MSRPSTTLRTAAVRPSRNEADAMLAWLERHGSKRNRDGMARYAIVSDKVFGISVEALRRRARRLGRNHDLAVALWDTGWHEARMLACFVDDPARVTPGQMDRWCRDFDNWAICDTVCGHLFDKTPLAWRKVDEWSGRRREFEKRAAFALLVSLAVHDKRADDRLFAARLPLIERTATDDRNFVKKAVSWALRTIGKRSPSLRKRSMVVARRLARSDDTAARWIGKDAMRELRPSG